MIGAITFHFTGQTDFAQGETCINQTERHDNSWHPVRKLSDKETAGKTWQILKLHLVEPWANQIWQLTDFIFRQTWCPLLCWTLRCIHFVFICKSFACIRVCLCMSVYHICAWCPWNPGESIVSSGTRVTDSSEMP